MSMVKILKILPETLPPVSGFACAAVSQVMFVDGRDWLNIDIYIDDELKGRYFTDKKERHSYTANGWGEYTLNNVARKCQGLQPLTGYRNYYDFKNYVWDTDEDEKRVLDYLDGWDLEFWECDMYRDRRYNKLLRKQNRIDNLMNTIPAVPDEMNTWLNETIFPGHFIFFDRGTSECSCTACGSAWNEKLKHGKTITCPVCGAEARTYSTGVAFALSRETHVILLQVLDEDRWVERLFKAHCEWSKGKKEIELYEDIRVVIKKGETEGKVYYGLYDRHDEYKQEWYDKNSANKRFCQSYLYPGNLKEVLPMGGLERSGLDLICTNRMDVNFFIRYFHDLPFLEYLIKGGYTRLAIEYINQKRYWDGTFKKSAANLKDCLGLDGNHLARLRQINGGFAALDWIRYEQRSGQKISQEALEYLSREDVPPANLKGILAASGSSVNKMVNYLKKQHGLPKDVSEFWNDYLSMAREEGMDTTDDIVRFPKDLRARHDQLVAVRNARRNAEEIERNRKKYMTLDNRIAERLPEVKRLFWENDDYMIIPAGKCEELVIEGQTLHHCVGASTHYMNEMAEGRSWICFLRRKEKLQEAYYTLQVSLETDKVMQWYSAYDRKPDENAISKVIRKYEAYIKKERKKAAAKIADQAAVQPVIIPAA